MATKAAEKLLPLLARFAEKRPEHPKDSLRISVDHFEMVKSRTDKKFEHADLPKGASLPTLIAKSTAAPIDELLGRLNLKKEGP